MISANWRRERELKDRAFGYVGGRPQSSAVRVNDGAGDRQANPQAARLCCIERVKDELEARDG